jgi:Ca2+-binding RTX toxin-like protein
VLVTGRPGKAYRRVKLGLFAASATIALAISSPALAAITLGPNPLPQRTGVTASGGARIFANNVVPGATLTAPLDGVVVRWRARRGSGGGVLVADTLTLRILRPTGVANEFTASGTSDAHAVPGGSSDPIDVYEFPTQLSIKTNDRLGLGTITGEFAGLDLAGASYLTRINVLDDGQTATFAAGAFADRAVLMNADIEPDCDSDGLGDETQDSNLSTCPSGTTPTGPAPGGATCKGIPATIVGTGGNDVRIASPGRDVIVGLGGNDSLSGLAGNDVICGGAGRDRLKGGPGNDFLSGQKGSDKLAGQKGKDKLSGKKGKDVCVGGPGQDKAKGCEKTKSI